MKIELSNPLSDSKAVFLEEAEPGQLYYYIHAGPIGVYNAYLCSIDVNSRKKYMTSFFGSSYSMDEAVYTPLPDGFRVTLTQEIK